MNIGPRCEISTIMDVVPETLRIGAESFFADGIYLGGPRIHRGTVTIRDTSLGRGTFLGNHVVIPAGERLPDDFFLGVCTVADARQSRPGTSWFGHPPVELPRREVVNADRRLTHNPGPLRFANRLVWETLRCTLPILPLFLATGWLWAIGQANVPWPALILLVVPAATMAMIFLPCLVVFTLKWTLLGRARAGQHVLWSCWCSRWDFLYVAWQFYALSPLATLEGTLLLAMWLRAMGARIGRRVVLGPGLVQLADPDMIIIEDGATVNANYQAHSFEDRVLKLGPVVVRRGATVGESAVVFYGADIGEGAWVTPNSVVMKHERLSPGHTYSGCPIQALK
jgi:non-ribosomal peptide synthetase-like protein